MSKDHECKPTILAGQPFAFVSHKPDGQDAWIHLCCCSICKQLFALETETASLRYAAKVEAT